MTNTTTPSANDSGLNLDHLEALRRVIECCEILNQRPRPMCRDCADEDGKCPNGGLDCDMRGLFARAKAGYNELARRAAPVSAPIASDLEAEYTRGRVDGERIGRETINIHLDAMKTNKHYREREFKEILRLDAEEGLKRFTRAALANQPAPIAAPEQVEPVAWRYRLRRPEGVEPDKWDVSKDPAWAARMGPAFEVQPLFTHTGRLESQPSEAAPLDRRAVLEEAARVVEEMPCSRDSQRPLLNAAEAIRELAAAPSLPAAAPAPLNADKKRIDWLIANPRWSIRWRIHTKKKIEQWQMVDDGESWRQWGEYRAVLDAAIRAAQEGEK